jgi:F0F1-type ATP synthase membrane subunit b/b'
MLFYCPECESKMDLTESAHVCPNEDCGKSITLDEAKTMFDEGELVGLVEESEAEDIVSESDDVVVASIDEDISALVEGEELSEEFVAKAKTIFEAAVKTRVSEQVEEIKESLEEEYEKMLEEETAKIFGTVDTYLDTVVTEWLEENKLAVETGIKKKMDEEFMAGMAELFKEHYFQVPGERWDLVEGLASEVEELRTKLDESATESKETEAELLEAKKAIAFIKLSEDLAETQKEKLLSLSENIEAGSVDEFVEKVKVIKESYFKDKSEETVDDKETVNEDLESPIAAALRLLSANH